MSTSLPCSEEKHVSLHYGCGVFLCRWSFLKIYILSGVRDAVSSDQAVVEVYTYKQTLFANRPVIVDSSAQSLYADAGSFKTTKVVFFNALCRLCT